MNYSVYKLTAPNGKVYIGITSRDPKRRWNAGHGYIYNKHFTNAIQKYGWVNIKKEVLFSGISQQEAYNLEIKLISEYRSNEIEYGYNKSPGGESSVRGLRWHKSREAVERQAEKMRGRKLSEEHKRKLSESHKGKPGNRLGLSVPEETKIKISNSLKKWNAEHISPNKGRTRKRAQWEIEKVAKAHYKKIICIETGIVYESIKEASENNNIDSSSITKVCKGLRETAGGFHWRYQKDV